jgi:hypothetical protein
MEPERSLPCSQEPATEPYPEPVSSSSYHHTIFYSVLLSSHPRLRRFLLGFRYLYFDISIYKNCRNNTKLNTHSYCTRVGHFKNRFSLSGSLFLGYVKFPYDTAFTFSYRTYKPSLFFQRHMKRHSDKGDALFLWTHSNLKKKQLLSSASVKECLPDFHPQWQGGYTIGNYNNKKVTPVPHPWVYSSLTQHALFLGGHLP